MTTRIVCAHCAQPPERHARVLTKAGAEVEICPTAVFKPAGYTADAPYVNTDRPVYDASRRPRRSR